MQRQVVETDDKKLDADVASHDRPSVYLHFDAVFQIDPLLTVCGYITDMHCVSHRPTQTSCLNLIHSGSVHHA